jgi:hypothetical protein
MKMSEIVLLEEEIQRKHRKYTSKLYKEFLFKMAKIKEICSHGETHWIQEITKDGIVVPSLKKRCYLCGLNIEELKVEPEFIEQLMADFDKKCEEKKLISTPIKGEG